MRYPYKQRFILCFAFVLSIASVGCRIEFINSGSDASTVSDGGTVSVSDSGQPTPGIDAGTVQLGSGAGLVATLAPLPEPACGRLESQQRALCPDDGGAACVSFVRPGQTPEIIARETDISPSNPGTLYPLGATHNGVFLRTIYTEGIGFAESGAAPRKIEAAPPGGQTLRVDAFAVDPNGGAWYRQGIDGVSGSFNLMFVPPGGTAITVAPFPAAELVWPVEIGGGYTAPVAHESEYVVALKDGIHYFSRTGSGHIPLSSVSGQTESIRALAVDHDFIFFAQCIDDVSGATKGCGVRRYDRYTGTTETLVPTSSPLRIGSMAIVGQYLYLLGVQDLYRIPLAGGALEPVYRGEEFPQYGGTLRGSHLRAINGKLYFGQICHFDEDAPTYAAVELDPTSLSARYLELDPAYPFVPYLEPNIYINSAIFPTPNGIIQFHW